MSKFSNMPTVKAYRTMLSSRTMLSQYIDTKRETNDTFMSDAQICKITYESVYPASTPVDCIMTPQQIDSIEWSEVAEELGALLRGEDMGARGEESKRGKRGE